MYPYTWRRYVRRRKETRAEQIEFNGKSKCLETEFQQKKLVILDLPELFFMDNRDSSEQPREKQTNKKFPISI